MSISNENNRVKYKNIKVKEDIYPFMKYMESVEDYRENLLLLSNTWDSLAIMGKLGRSNIDMELTKKNFSTLTEELLNHLSEELLKKSVREMTAKASIAIDIVIRNLFERTADIGFLATDDDIRYFLQNTVSKYASSYDENIIHIKNRFEEYVQKYSVYFDIVLMDTQGNVLANLVDDIDLPKSKDEVINLVLNTNEDYIETYKYHDFTPQYKKTLVYSYKVQETNDKDSKIIGILSLCFRFTNEMEGVFENLINPDTQECITILDNSGKVIASSDKYHIPINAKVELVLDKMYKVVSFGGRYYLAKTCKTKGYQGFMGLGWYGHIMVPIENAFLNNQKDDINIKNSLLEAILQHGENFSNELKQIPIQAKSIQNNLHRAVWNGNITTNDSQTVDKGFSRTLLNEIAKTGEQTREIFNSSIINLTKTIILNDTVSIASLMIDIMDRNLYERANDCRWWALTSEFRKTLSKSTIDNTDVQKLCKILKYINDLYTVYTNLFIYDKDGVIIAVSNPKHQMIISKKLSNIWVNDTLKIKSSSQYCVSNFEQSELYENRPTYIYNASIKSLENESDIVGGIGIVFDSEVEFYEMIKDSMPRYVTGEIKKGVFGLFVAKDKTIISSTNQNYKVGTKFDIDDKFFELSNGQTYSQIITLDNKLYAVGVKCSQGYREYKSAKDNYSNDVFAFFFSYISEADILNSVSEEYFFQNNKVIDETDVDYSEIATFHIGEKYLGVHTKDVLEAISIDKLESSIVLDDDNYFKGTVPYKKNIVSVLDIRPFIKEESKAQIQEIIMMRYSGAGENHYIGILVDKLENVIDIETNRIKKIESHFISGGALIESIVSLDKNNHDNQDTKLLTILNISKIGAELTK
jgi:chemotaxis signal transduction protein